MTKTFKCFILFMTLAVSFASAATYKIQLFQSSTVAGKDLKPGEYKLTLDNDKVVLKQGKESVEATVRTETSDSKFSSTSVRYANENGKMKVQEIRLGGTTTKIVFN